LQLQLRKAKELNHFIPFEYTFGDAAVTGTTSHRKGYQGCLALLGAKEACVVALYIDEIGRASREAIEALRLGERIERNRQRLIGVSDGFDSTSPMAKMQLSIFGMLNQWFIDQLRSKVQRGMKDAFRRGTSTGRPPLGYKLEAAFDSQTQPIRGRDNEHLKWKVIDNQWTSDVLIAFERFANLSWSRTRLARDFNLREVGGRSTWDASTIGKLLSRRLYIGIEIYNATYQVRNIDTGRIEVVTRPRSEWLVQRNRSLQIVPYSLWKKSKARLKLSKVVYAKCSKKGATRTDYAHTILIRPWCKDCNKPLWLGRSGPEGSFACHYGLKRSRGCTLTGYKRMRIFNELILDVLKERFLTDERVEELLLKANQFLVLEASRPQQDAGPLKRQLKDFRARQARLQKLLQTEGEEGLKLVVREIRDTELKASDLQTQLDRIERSRTIPQPISAEDIRSYLPRLREILGTRGRGGCPSDRAADGQKLRLDGQATRQDYSMVSGDYRRSRGGDARTFGRKEKSNYGGLGVPKNPWLDFSHGSQN
jgi:DNA invertase Pin-like site-specific DNA recombinase